jgi:hypothetical protein
MSEPARRARQRVWWIALVALPALVALTLWWLQGAPGAPSFLEPFARDDAGDDASAANDAANATGSARGSSGKPLTPQARIAQALDALGRFGRGDVEAAQFELLSAGKAAIEPIRARLHALRDAGEQPQAVTERMQLLNVLAQLGDPAAVEIAIDVSRRAAPDSMLHQNAFAVVIGQPRSEDAVAYALECIRDPASSQWLRRQALGYFLVHPDPDAESLALRLAQDDPDSRLVDAALWVAARAGRTEAVPMIQARLAAPTGTTADYYAAMALAELVDETSFDALTADLPLSPVHRQSARRYARFRAGDAAGKQALLAEMLEHGQREERSLVVQYLIEERRTDLMKEHRLFARARDGRWATVRWVSELQRRNGLRIDPAQSDLGFAAIEG